MYRFLVLSILVPCGGSGLAVAQAPTAEKPEHDVPLLPQIPDVRLRLLDGASSESEFLNSVGDRAAALLAESQGQSDEARVNARLAAANLILARQMAPVCSRSLLAVPNANDPTRARDALARARTILDDAKALIDAADAGHVEPPVWIRSAEIRHQTLGSFATAFDAIFMSADRPDRARTLRRAATKLWPLTEDDDPEIAIAARLWQAFLRGYEDDVNPAIETLDLALAKPDEKTRRLAFMSTLLRCRLLARQGGYAVSLALANIIEERCDEWFTTADDRGDALRTTTLIELAVLSDWFEAIEGEGRDDERRWCAQRMRDLIEARLTGEQITVLGLDTTFPLTMAKRKTREQPAPGA